MPQNLDEIDDIIKTKVHAKVNKKTYEKMREALDTIENDKKIDRKIALAGLILLGVVIYFIATTYFNI